MEYPKIKIDGKTIKLDKKLFDLVRTRIEESIAFDDMENDMGLSIKDIQLLSWNSAVMLFPIIQYETL